MEETGLTVKVAPGLPPALRFLPTMRLPPTTRLPPAPSLRLPPAPLHPAARLRPNQTTAATGVSLFAFALMLVLVLVLIIWLECVTVDGDGSLNVCALDNTLNGPLGNAVSDDANGSGGLPGSGLLRRQDDSETLEDFTGPVLVYDIEDLRNCTVRVFSRLRRCQPRELILRPLELILRPREPILPKGEFGDL